MRVKKIALLLFSIFFFLTGCQKVDNEAAFKATESLASTQSDLVGQFQSLHELETEFQNVFEKSLNAEDDLSNLADQKDPIYENINQRHQIAKNMAEAAEKAQESIETLENYEGEDLSSDAFQPVINQIKQLIEKINSFQKNYDAHLETQGNYLISLSKEDATHEDLTDGISTINDEYAEDQKAVKELDTLFLSLNSDLETLLGQLSQLVNQEAK